MVDISFDLSLNVENVIVSSDYRVNEKQIFFLNLRTQILLFYFYLLVTYFNIASIRNDPLCTYGRCKGPSHLGGGVKNGEYFAYGLSTL